MEARESRMSKCRKLFLDEASNSALKVYQPLDREEPSTSAVQVYQPLAQEEPSTSAVQVYQPPTREEPLTSAVQGECHRIVLPSEVEAEFLKQTGRKYKKDAWQDIASWFGFSLTHSQPRSEGWIMDDFKKFSLECHPDAYALDK
ncbi:hypothetical protein R1flu_001912 [Riccia fluitans]|uniref:Uncharacterized protein n=1 Tax=Riccia fluitans TaxID=41844 RepID=A0ABD1Y7Y5_9MARC